MIHPKRAELSAFDGRSCAAAVMVLLSQYSVLHDMHLTILGLTLTRMVSPHMQTMDAFHSLKRIHSIHPPLSYRRPLGG